MATAPPDLGTLDLSLGGGTDTAPAATQEPATQAPAWTSNPMVTPLEQLGATGR